MAKHGKERGMDDAKDGKQNHEMEAKDGKQNHEQFQTCAVCRKSESCHYRPRGAISWNVYQAAASRPATLRGKTAPMKQMKTKGI